MSKKHIGYIQSVQALLDILLKIRHFRDTKYLLGCVIHIILSNYRQTYIEYDILQTLLLFNDICILTSEKNDTQLSEHTSERELRENLNSDISYKKAYRFFSILLGFGSRFGKWRRFFELKLGNSVTNLMKKFNLSWKGLPSIQTTMSINLLLKPLKFIIKGKKNNT